MVLSAFKAKRDYMEKSDRVVLVEAVVLDGWWSLYRCVILILVFCPNCIILIMRVYCILIIWNMQVARVFSNIDVMIYSTAFIVL